MPRAILYILYVLEYDHTYFISHNARLVYCRKYMFCFILYLGNYLHEIKDIQHFFILIFDQLIIYFKDQNYHYIFD